MVKIGTTPRAEGVRNTSDANIPYDTSFTGNIETKTGIRIDGTIKGNVLAAGNVTIGADGNVEGTVTGKDIGISGNVLGNVYSYGAVQMLPGAKLVGDLQAASVAIAQGAYFKGKCIVTENRADNAADCLGKVENKVMPCPAAAASKLSDG